ncbi:hypothetical protein BZA05DRAFT_139370 [Tricharina praecox]|uniref:uncharacterized protein n=1 Tax=Tricharina praecox TaxID=43433 RepID=UPI00221FDD82|nr:uncharacterized protein BZA05DRAFT_139370 [Tricharina praecox]KAI5846107.1 hypothetical protein BZA05DRAFT_139370 [Tricharina praecox]
MARRYSTLNMLNPSHQADFYRPGSSEGSYSPSDESHSYDLLPLSSVPTPGFSPEALGAKILGPGHLSTILSNPTLLSNFADFLTHSSPSGLNTLVQYLDSQKALKALAYANAIAGGLEGGAVPADVRSKGLERCSDEAFEGLLEELAGYVTNTVVDVVSHNVTRRITGELRSDLADAVDGLGESFCLTDPRRDGNPIIFMSEEFNRVTQYGVSYAVGRNCRFLQGPATDRKTVRRLKNAIDAQKETSELFLNYRRDGSPFFNLLMVAPLFDSQGQLRYYIGAQVDVTQLLKDGIGLDSVKELERQLAGEKEDEEKDVFQELAELFNDVEIETTRLFAGRLHKGRRLRREGAFRRERAPSAARSRVMVQEGPPSYDQQPTVSIPRLPSLKGVYQNYMLLRPYPSLRILFTSPSLRTPGIHQLHFLNKIGGSPRVRDEIHDALRTGNGVTAKVTWLTNRESAEGRERFVHCTPLLDGESKVGVWMVIVADPVHRGRRETSVYHREQVRIPSPSPSPERRPGADRTRHGDWEDRRPSHNNTTTTTAAKPTTLRPPQQHLPPTPTSPCPSTPTSPVPRIVRHDVEVPWENEEAATTNFRLSDHIPARASSWGKGGKREKCDVDAFAKSLGLLASN